jgi:hypothetical protein
MCRGRPKTFTAQNDNSRSRCACGRTNVGPAVLSRGSQVQQPALTTSTAASKRLSPTGFDAYDRRRKRQSADSQRDASWDAICRGAASTWQSSNWMQQVRSEGSPMVGRRLSVGMRAFPVLGGWLVLMGSSVLVRFGTTRRVSSVRRGRWPCSSAGVLTVCYRLLVSSEHRNSRSYFRTHTTITYAPINTPIPLPIIPLPHLRVIHPPLSHSSPKP